MARITQDFPSSSLKVSSADYQPEGEEYLEQIGANRIEHTLIMSRSVWHKVRESKLVSLEGIQLPEMLQGLQPARKPIPGGMLWKHEQRKQMLDRVKLKKLSKENIALPYKKSNLEGGSQSASKDTQQE